MRRPSLNSTALLMSTRHIPGYIFGEQIYKRALQGNRKIAYIPVAAGPRNGDQIGPQMRSFGRFKTFFHDQYHGVDIVPFYFSGHLSGKQAGLLETMIKNFEVIILAGGNLGLAMQRLRGISANFYHNPFRLERMLEEREAEGLLSVGDGAGASVLCHNAAAVAPNIMVVPGYDLSPARQAILRSIARSNPLCMCIGLPANASLEVSRGQFPFGTAYQFIEVSIDHSGDVPADQNGIPTQRGIDPVICYKDGHTQWRLRDGDTIGRAILPPSKKEVGWGNKKRQFWHFRAWVESPRAGGLFNLFTRGRMQRTMTDDGWIRVTSIDDILRKKYFDISTWSNNW